MSFLRRRNISGVQLFKPAAVRRNQMDKLLAAPVTGLIIAKGLRVVFGSQPAAQTLLFNGRSKTFIKGGVVGL